MLCSNGIFLSCMNDGSLREHPNDTPEVTMEMVDYNTETCPCFQNHKKGKYGIKGKAFKKSI